MERIIKEVSFILPQRLETKRVAAYARVSSGKDAMLHSLAAQVSYYSNLIQNHKGWLYSGVYSDEAKTGTKDAREAFQRLMSDCKAGKIDMVITKSISRFARNTVTLLQTIRELKAIGVDVYFEEQNIHTLSSEGELLLTILASYAQEESRSVSENCKWRIRNNFEQGIPHSFQIYGYNMKNHCLVINPEEAEVVKKIFQMYLEGAGTHKIAKYLNENGVKAPKGDVWRAGRINTILKNEKYIGDLLLQKFYSENHITKRKITNRGELKKYYVSGNHEPIVDKATFDKVQEILLIKNENAPYVEPYEYKFKGIVYCAVCGDRYTRKKINSGTVSEKYVWKCRTYSHKGKAFCPNRQIPDDVLIDMADGFDKEISKIIIHDNNRVQFLFNEGSEAMRTWEIDRRWTDEMKQRNYHNQRRAHG